MPDIVSPTATPPTDWFCEATGAEWDCAEADDGKAVTRLPPVQRQVQGATRAGESGVGVEPAQERERPVYEPTSGEAERPRPPASGLASLHRDASPERQRAASTDTALPAYLRLAYRPDREIAFTDLPDEFFAVQLLALSSAEAVEKFVVDAGVPGLAAARIERDGSLLYVLLLGIYRDRTDAARAAANAPVELGHLSPWIRPLRTLKEAMLRADSLAARQDDP